MPDDRFAYVANMADDTISVIDIGRGEVARTIPAGDEPDGSCLSPTLEGDSLGLITVSLTRSSKSGRLGESVDGGQA